MKTEPTPEMVLQAAREKWPKPSTIEMVWHDCNLYQRWYLSVIESGSVCKFIVRFDAPTLAELLERVKTAE
jgi:hypothetical protein